MMRVMAITVIAKIAVVLTIQGATVYAGGCAAAGSTGSLERPLVRLGGGSIASRGCCRDGCVLGR